MSCYRQNLFERLSLFNLPNHQRPQSRHRGSLDSQIVRDSRRFCLQESQQRQRLPKRGLHLVSSMLSVDVALGLRVTSTISFRVCHLSQSSHPEGLSWPR